jgi:S-DNA-T family DNA segregation ATPase FtsK/SpoIIIE
MAKKEKNIAGAKDADLKQEKLQRISFKQFIKDERTHKITGSIFVLMSLLLFVSFTSYLSTWDEDQDKLISEGNKLFWGTDTEVANLMGTFGAFIAHLFMYKGFGVASYLFCGFFFVIGVNLLFSKSVFSIARNLRYLIVGLPLLSITASAFFSTNPFPWGGAVGDLSKLWMFKVIGSFGTFALIFIAFWAYIIWRFNPQFNKLMEARKNKSEDVNMAPVEETPEPVKPKKEKKEEEAKLFIAPGVEEKETDLELVDKDEIEPVVEELDNDDIVQELPTNTQGLELEIKKVEPEIIEEEVAEKKVTVTPYDPILDLRDYKFPTLDLLENHGSEKIIQDPQELENNKNQIINTLKNYDISIQKISATVGPTVTLYEIIPAAGVRISRIKNLEDDIALSLAALGIRIIAPIPGKGTIGIEVPNAKKTIVSMKTLLSADKFTKNNFALPIAIGKKIDNENFIVDLASMPHLLMAGATGQGKSVGLNAILVSLLYSKHPSQLKFVLVDPKKVELSIYKTIERHFLAKLPGEEDAIITDTKKVVHTLNALCIEMDNRYDLLKEAGCRNIREYNEKFAERKLNPEKGHQFLPFIVLVVDEFADLIMTAGKEVEMPIARLAQLARAVGIHLIIATQRPSVNIITGTIKANFPARIAFKVSSKIDSRTILDAGGAEQLIGKGDMLINYNGEIVRLQCAFVDTPEVDKIVDFIGDQRGYPQAFMLPEYIDEKDADGKDFDVNDKDALFEDAARLIVSSQSGSTSLLQRRMKLGYNRAGRLMDQLEAAGIVGASQGSKVRDVLVKTEAELQEILNRLL